MPRIAELTAFHVRIPLKRTVKHASHTRDDTDSLVVCCRLTDGTRGWGEGLPRSYVTGDTIESVFQQLQETNWSSQLGGDLPDLHSAMDVCSRFSLPVIQPGMRDSFGNSARCAVELSILDAAARVAGRPLSDVTRLLPEGVAIRTSIPRVQYSAAFTPMGPWAEWLRAWKLRIHGFNFCKVKVAVPGHDDVAMLTRLRKVFADRVDIRADANEAWTCANLQAKLAPLMKFGLSAIEQPVPHAEVDGLAALRGRLGLPIMLDESLCSLSDARRAIERGTCDLFNIRLSKCGGFLTSLRFAALARGAGLGSQLGCQVGETGILSAAGRHFASSVSGLRYIEGSFDRFLVRERLTREDLTFGRRGFAPALTGPGLGVHIDEASLRRVVVSEHHFVVS